MDTEGEISLSATQDKFSLWNNSYTLHVYGLMVDILSHFQLYLSQSVPVSFLYIFLNNMYYKFNCLHCYVLLTDEFYTISYSKSS